SPPTWGRCRAGVSRNAQEKRRPALLGIMEFPMSKALTLTAIALAVAVAIAANCLAVILLPPIDEQQTFQFERPHQNWFGQNGGTVFVMTIAFEVAVAAARYPLVSGRLPKAIAVPAYTLVVALSFPIIWFFLVTEWFNPHF